MLCLTPFIVIFNLLHLYDLKFKCSRVPADVFLYPVRNANVRKKASIFFNFILLFYRFQVKTILLQVFFTLNKYKSNFLKGEFQWLPHPQLI